MGCGGLSYCDICSHSVHFGVPGLVDHRPWKLQQPEELLAIDLQNSLLNSRDSDALLAEVARRLASFGSASDLTEIARPPGNTADPVAGCVLIGSRLA